MNIIVKPYESSYAVCRPDTTWERENRDIYVPDGMAGFRYAPVLFARVSKAGKCIAGKFASRYYDGIGYGVLLYPVAAEGRPGVPDAAASCFDHTSILPFPLYNKVTLESGDNFFNLYRNGEQICSTSCGSDLLLEETLAAASRHISLRIGDIVCVEFAPAVLLTDRDAPDTEIRGTFCGNETFRLTIKNQF